MQEQVKATPSLLAHLFILFVRLYQITLRPFLGGHCRFQPTCSDYAIEALKKYGGCRGFVKSLYRILRCNPFGGCGHDPP
jgi:putative membrane protein insertion efficiency factor